MKQKLTQVPVLHYLQVVLLIKIWTIFMNILYNSLKSGGTKDQFRWVKVPGTTPDWSSQLKCKITQFFLVLLDLGIQL